MDNATQKRIERINQGCCPIHGQAMTQIDRWYEDVEGKEYTIVGCSRNACLIIAKAYSSNGPWQLLDEFVSLLKFEEADSKYLDLHAEPKKRKKSLKKLRKSIWEKTKGYCYYCGDKITLESMTIDHLSPEIYGGLTEIENLFPSCKLCNSVKGAKNIEAFRFLLQMRSFKEVNGVSFSMEQILYLQNHGYNINIPDYRYWFEKQK